MRFAIEKSIGETRIAALNSDDEPVSLFIWRDRVLDGRARPGDIFPAIVRSIDKGLAGVYVELKNGEPGFFNLSPRHKAPPEGAHMTVLVRAEAHAGKSAIVRPVNLEPGLIEFEDAVASWKAGFAWGNGSVSEVEGCEAEAIIDAALDEVMNPKHVIAGGGDIFIEQTRGFTAVDVDSSGRLPSAGSLNEAALVSLARQVSLRRLSGLIIVDLVGAPKAEKALKLRDVFRDILKTYGFKQCEVLAPSALGVLEATIARTNRPVFCDEMSADPSDFFMLEVAVGFFREALRVGERNRSARLGFIFGEKLAVFLKMLRFDWKGELAGKIGYRFQCEQDVLSDPTGYEIIVK